MKKIFQLLAIILTAGLLLTACSTTPSNTPSNNNNNNNSETVEFTDAHGTVSIPVNPQRVVSLDNRTFETLANWDIELVAVPKGVMDASSPYVLDENVQDIGNHREPNLEILAAADPELVIVGQRFASYYDDIKAIVPNAVVIDLNFDVSEEAATPGENLVNGFKETTTLLGQIFNKEAEATALINDLDTSIANAKAAYNGEDTVMSVIVSGGNIGFSAPGAGRVWGPLYEILGLVGSLDVENTTSDHQGDEISVEAIAQSNPKWLFVLDRDAAVADTNSSPAQDVIDNSPALQNTTAIKEGNFVYAPNGTYTNESIQTFILIFDSITEAFSK